MENLSVKVWSIDDKVRFDASTRDNSKVTLDYTPPLGTGQGYTSLELLMISFGTCTSTALLALLRNRKRRNVAGIDAEVDGVIREEHPKSLESMKATLHIKSNEVSEQEAMEMLKVAEESVCPVWNMLKGNVAIEVEIKIEKV